MKFWNYRNREFSNRLINGDTQYNNNNNSLNNNNNFSGDYYKGYDGLGNSAYMDTRAQDTNRRSFHVCFFIEFNFQILVYILFVPTIIL